MSMQVLGLRELQAELKKVAKDIELAQDPAAMAAGEPIKEAWRGLVPVEAGYYQESITVAWLGKLGKAAVGTAWMPSVAKNEQPVLYASRLEYGDSEMPAQPSAKPALAQSRDDAIQAAEVPLKAALKRRKRKRKPVA